MGIPPFSSPPPKTNVAGSGISVVNSATTSTISINGASTTNANISVYYPASASNYWSMSTTSGGYQNFSVTGTIPTPTVLSNNNFVTYGLAASSLPGMSFTAPSTGTVEISFNMISFHNTSSMQCYYQLYETNTSTVIAYASEFTISTSSGPLDSIAGYLSVTQGTSYNIILQANGNGGNLYSSYTPTVYTSPQGGLQINVNYVGLTSIAGAGYSRSINSISTNTNAGSASSTDYIYILTASGITLTLPTAVSNTNRYTIKNASGGTVYVATTSSQTIDGSSSPISILPPSASLEPSLDIISNNANWNII